MCVIFYALVSSRRGLSCCGVPQDVKHEIKRDPRGNTTVTDLTMERVDPNDGAGVDEIMQVRVWYTNGRSISNKALSPPHSSNG